MHKGNRETSTKEKMSSPGKRAKSGKDLAMVFEVLGLAEETVEFLKGKGFGVLGPSSFSLRRT